MKVGLGGQFVFFSPGVVIIEATPPEAQVWLDGLSLGSAGQRVARAFSLSPGLHTVQVAASGLRPFSARFIVARGFPTRIRVALTPE